MLATPAGANKDRVGSGLRKPFSGEEAAANAHAPLTPASPAKLKR